MFKQKVIWITGASSGIGRALSEAFAKEGANLIVSSIDKPAIEKIAHDLRDGGCDARDLTFDVENLDALGEAASQAESMFGRIDMLINNAGVSQRSLFLETSLSVIKKLVTINLLSQMYLSKAVLPGMIDRGSGVIAGVASIAGKFGAPLRTAYCASKHGLLGFYDSLRAELRGRGVRVASIVPGFVRTDISKNALTGEGQTHGITDRNQELGVSPETCAAQIVRGLLRGGDEIYCGMNAKARVSLFLNRWFPGALRNIVAGENKS